MSILAREFTTDNLDFRVNLLSHVDVGLCFTLRRVCVIYDYRAVTTK